MRVLGFVIDVAFMFLSSNVRVHVPIKEIG